MYKTYNYEKDELTEKNFGFKWQAIRNCFNGFVVKISGDVEEKVFTKIVPRTLGVNEVPYSGYYVSMSNGEAVGYYKPALFR